MQRLDICRTGYDVISICIKQGVKRIKSDVHTCLFQTYKNLKSRKVFSSASSMLISYIVLKRYEFFAYTSIYKSASGQMPYSDLRGGCQGIAKTELEGQNFFCHLRQRLYQSSEAERNFIRLRAGRGAGNRSGNGLGRPTDL